MPRRTERAFCLELADLPLLRPSLVAVTSLQALDAGTRSSGEQSLELHARFDLRQHGPLSVRQTFEGNGAGTGAVIYLLSLVGFLEMNNYADLDVAEIDIEFTQWEQPRVQKLKSVVPSRREVRPGDRVTLHLELEEYRGERVRRRFEVVVPDDLAPGPFYFFVGDGVSVDAARLQLEPSASQNLRDSLDLLRSFHGQDELVALGVRRGRGIVAKGRALPSLPGSVRSLWASSSGPAPKRLGLEVVSEASAQVPLPFDGLSRVDLTVLAARAHGE